MKFSNDRQRKAMFAQLNCAGLRTPKECGNFVNLNKFSLHSRLGSGGRTNDSLFAIGASVTPEEDYEDTSYGKEKRRVCPRCDGRGSHDPEWLSGGIGRSEKDEDPEFYEDYMNGDYDVTCEVCKGENVVADIISPNGYEIITNKYPIREDPSGAVYFYNYDYDVLKDGVFVKHFDERSKAIRFIKKEEGLVPKTTGVGKAVGGKILQ